MPVRKAPQLPGRTGTATLLLLASLALPPAGVNAQVRWIGVPPPTGQNLRAVFHADSLGAWAGGDSGIVLATSDGGASWSAILGADSLSVTDIFMSGGGRAWVTTIRRLVSPGDWNGSVLFSTTDGGASWSSLRDSGSFYNTVFFLDSLTGWLGGEWGLIRGTTDGGATWFSPSIDSTIWSSFPVIRLKFLTPLYGYAVGGYPESAGVIWRTVDGGAHWTVTGLGDALRGIHFVDSLEVILTGGGFDDGACMTRTADGGQSWMFSYVGPFGFGTSMAFRSAGEGWAPLGFTGTSMFTTDTGATWNEYANEGGVPTYGVSFAGGRHGIMVGDSGSVFRYNAPVAVAMGAQWNLIALPMETATMLADSLFPGASSQAFGYTPSGGYAVEETLRTGRGYWIKFASPALFEFQEEPRTADTVDVRAGWNMIGGLSVPVAASSAATDPPGIIVSPFFGFGAGYSSAAVLQPGRGYWVKVSADGALRLSAE